MTTEVAILGMSPAQVRRLKEASRDLAAMAAAQHGEAVAWVRESMAPHAVEACKVEPGWEVSVRELDTGTSDAMSHMVSLIKRDGLKVSDRDCEVIVYTDLHLTATAASGQAASVGYQTRVSAVVDGVLVDLRPTKTVGAAIS